MTEALILTVVIVIAIYFYMRYSAKRRRASEINSVKQYHDNYISRRNRRRLPGSDHTYHPYVTKYNSTEDYRERRGK